MNSRGFDLKWQSASKGELVIAIAEHLGVEPPLMSTGSTEPREIFAIVNRRLGLGMREAAGKQELARGIVEASGEAWHPDYESRGSTITKDGLVAVLRAVDYFLR